MPRLIARRCHVFHAMLFWATTALMAATAGLRAQGQPLALSQPANPWTAEPVEVLATLLIFPWEEGGRHYDGGSPHATELQLQIQGADLPHIGVIRGSVSWNHLLSLTQYDIEPGFVATPEQRETLARFFGATHVLGSSLEVDAENDLWHLSAILKGPGRDEAFERRFTVPRGHLYVLTAQVARWVGECMGELLTPEQVERLGSPIRGAGVTHSDAPEAAAFPADPTSPEWDALMAGHPELPYLPLMRAARFSAQEHRDFMRELAGKPLPAGSHPFLNMARGMLLSEVDPRAALHEWEILAARYPGVDQYSNRLLEYPLSIEVSPEDAVRRVERWHRRAPPSPYHDWRLAMVLHDAARELRGTGLANTVPEENWRRIHVLSARSAELTSEAIGKVGPLPILTQSLFDPLVLSGQWKGIHERFRESAGKYPYHRPLYAGYMNYLLPRWGGNHLFLLSFINETLDRDPDWLESASLVGDALYMESIFRVDRTSNPRPMQLMHDYLKDRKAWSDIVRKSMDRLMAPHVTTTGATLACTYAILLRDSEALVHIIKAHPETASQSGATLPNFCALDDYLPHTARETFEAGMPEACLQVVEAMSAARSSTLNPEYPKVFELWGMYKATSLAGLGRAEESEEIWALIPAESATHAHRWISWAVANHRVDEVLEESGRAYREKPGSLHVAGAHALALARSGQREKAREVISKVPLFEQNHRWTYLKNAVREIVLEEQDSDETP